MRIKIYIAFFRLDLGSNNLNTKRKAEIQDLINKLQKNETERKENSNTNTIKSKNLKETVSFIFYSTEYICI